jgi:sugar phosphate isomerase/epimerase
MLRPHVGYIQIKDALLADGTVVVAGAGDGQVVETVRALRADGFDGFFSLEPHLGEVSSKRVHSGPERFTQSWKAFTDILTSEGIAYA